MKTQKNLKTKNPFQPFTELQKLEEARLAHLAHQKFDQAFVGNSSLRISDFKSHLYMFFGAILFPEITKEIPITLFVPRAGDSHIGNLVRKDAFAEDKVNKFMKEIYYNQNNGNPDQLTKYLGDWIKELEKIFGVNDLLDENELLSRRLIIKTKVGQKAYKSSLKQELNDVVKTRENGETQYFKYSLSLNEEQKTQIEQFLTTNPKLTSVRKAINPVSEVKAQGKNKKKAKNKSNQDLFFDALVADCNGQSDESIEILEQLLEKLKEPQSDQSKQDAATKNETCAMLSRIYLEKARSTGDITTKKEYEAKFFNILKNITKLSSKIEYGLGCIYEQGDIFGEKDLAKAFKYYESAATKGNVNAQISLAFLYHLNYMENNSQENLRKSIKYYTLAATKGDAVAQCTLGIFYQRGEEVVQNIKKAAQFHKLAADQGNAVSQCELGNLYREGLGVEKDMSEAIKYYTLAANQGDIASQYNLAILHHTGFGVKKNMPKAIEYYELAANQGHCESQFKLGSLYCGQGGVLRDLPKAQGFIELAANQGFKNAEKLLILIKNEIFKEAESKNDQPSPSTKPTDSVQSLKTTQSKTK